MTFDVTLFNSATGERCVYHDGYARPDLPSDPAERIQAIYNATFIWDDGNYACDCNRRDFMCRVLHPEECTCADLPEATGCGDTIVMEQIVWHETGEVIWKAGEVVG